MYIHSATHGDFDFWPFLVYKHQYLTDFAKLCSKTLQLYSLTGAQTIGITTSGYVKLNFKLLLNSYYVIKVINTKYYLTYYYI